MEAIARHKLNLLKNKLFKKDSTSGPGYHVTSRDENSRDFFSDYGGAGAAETPGGDNDQSDDSEEEEEGNKTVGRVLQKFNDLKGRFFNKAEYRNVGENAPFAASSSGYNQQRNDNSNVSSEDEPPDISFRGPKEVSIFKENFQKLKNKLFKDTDSSDGFEQQSHLIRGNHSASDWLSAEFSSPIRDENGPGAGSRTRSSDLRSFFESDSDSAAGGDGGNADDVGNGPEAGRENGAPRLNNFFDSCVEDDDDTEIELFSLPAEKLGLLDRRRETDSLLNMNDADVIDLQADGSAINLNADESPEDLTLRNNRIRKMRGTYNVYLVVAAIMAALGGMLFGYDTGIVSGALLQLTDDFELSCLQRETIVSSLLIGAIVASLTGGFIIDYIGRRAAIIVNAIVFILGAIVLSLAPNFATLIVGRLIVGFAVSLSASAECVYISEISPAKIRGRLVSLNELGITLGFLIAYLTSFLFIRMDNGWRYMFGLSVIPAVLQGVGMFFMPPSPRFLFMSGKSAEAQVVLQKIHGKSDYETEMNSIQSAQVSFKGRQVFELCSSVDNMRSRLLIGMTVLFFQQFTGQPSVLYYAPTLFQSIGYSSDTAATLATVGLGVVKVIMTVLCLLIVDRCGRRCLLLVGTSLMLLGITLLGITTIATPHVVRDPCANLQDTYLALNVSNATTSTTTTLSVTMSTPLATTTTAMTIAMTTTQDSVVVTTSNTNDTQMNKRNVVNFPADLHVIKRESQSANQSSEENSTISSVIGQVNGSEAGMGGNETEVPPHGSGRWFSLVALMMYIAGYAIGFGPVSWLILSEIFPSHVRGRAISVATVFNWGTNLLVALTFLNLMSALNVSGIFLLYGGICLLSLVFIFVCVPETKGRTLEQLSHQLQSRNYVRENLGACCGSQGEEDASLHTAPSTDYSALQNETTH